MSTAEQPTKTSIKSWIREHCDGKTFADVGGLWGLLAEKVTVALEAGATQATMVDFLPQSSPWWDKLTERLEAKNLDRNRCTFVSGRNLELPDFADDLGRFDFVTCAGVLYHVPNPFACVANLWKITGEYLAIATQILPQRIQTEVGTLDIPKGGALCVPSLTDREQAILASFYNRHNYNVTNINRGKQAYFNPLNGSYSYGPSYWLGGISWLTGLVESAPFTVVDTVKLSDHGVAMLCRRETGEDLLDHVASPSLQAQPGEDDS